MTSQPGCSLPAAAAAAVPGAAPTPSDIAVLLCPPPRPRLQVVSTDAMDAMADWPTMQEDFRFDAPTPSDDTWHR